MSNLTSFKAIIFDVYGTLVDWETPIHEGLLPILKKYPASAAWSRKEALKAYGAVETDLEAQHPDWLYAKVLEKGHEELERRLSGAGSSVATETGSIPSTASTSASVERTDETTDNPHIKFAQSIRDWPPFPDTIAALKSLADHYKLTVLSNVDHQSFAYTHAKLSEDTDNLDLYTFEPQSGVESQHAKASLDPSRFFHPQHNPRSKSPFTLVLTAQDTGAYKPAPAGLGTAIECILNDPEFGIKDKSEILVVAVSLFHDVYPAHRLGLQSVWIHRQGTCMGLDVEDRGVELEGGGGQLGINAEERLRQLGEGKWTWRFETLGGFAADVEKAFARK